MRRTSSVQRAVAAAVVGVAVWGCAGQRRGEHPPGPGAARPVDAPNFVLHVCNKSTRESVVATVYVDDVRVSERAYAKWPDPADRGISLHLSPGVHRIRATAEGLSAVADVPVRAEETLCQVLYDDVPRDLGWMVVPPGLRIEPIGRCGVRD